MERAIMIPLALATPWFLGQFNTGEPLVDHVFGPLLQLGFGAAFLMAMGLVFWFARTRRDDWRAWHRESLSLQRETNKVLLANAEAHVKTCDALVGLAGQLSQFGVAVHRLTEEMLARPCLLPQEDQE